MNLNTISFRMNLKVPVACNCKCVVETGGFCKVTGSAVDYKSGNISEMMQDKDVVIADHS